MRVRDKGVRISLGEIEGLKVGAKRFDWRDPYYLVLTVSWPAFFGLAVAFYLLTNLCFALAYLVVPGCVNGARPGVFIDHFFFSIETLATVGYGVMSPATLYGHTVASTEIIFGLMSMAVITGLVFTRFSRPRGRLMFSRVAVIADINGRTELSMRVMNRRHQALADATARLTVLQRASKTVPHSMRRFVDLKLERSEIPMLGLSWTMIHVIDEKSPLHGVTREQLGDMMSTLLVSVNGYDESISSAIVARHTYLVDTILFDRRFADIISDSAEGQVVLDVRRFHDTMAVEDET
jgi:inward rectifier potassium channel